MMTVLCFASPGTRCCFPVNSLPLSGIPSVYAVLMQKLIFAEKFADIFAVNSVLWPDQRINSESAMAPKLRSCEDT